ncbi:MAG: C10 family peptidase [Muribaculaceae bacterium]|nr:C10 family peptidase [Muribaculaceae bacterium]
MSNICKKYLLNLLVPIGILTLGLSACHDAYDQPESASSAEQALLSKLQHYYDDLPGQSRSGNSISIKEIEQRHYVIVDDTVVETPQTRTLDPNSFDITRVSLNIDGKEGFAIISEDERLDHVYYFTDNGCISDTVRIGGLKWVIEQIPYFAATELLSEKPVTRADFGEMIVAPLVRFNWHQGYPFNILAPYCTCKSCAHITHKNHNPMGCVTIAVGQTIAKICLSKGIPFKGTYFGSRDLDFCTLPADWSSFSEMTKQRIAHFCHEIAVCCQVKFGCTGSSTSVHAAYNYLQDLGYECTFAENTTLDITRLINNLKKGFPQIMGGHDLKTGDGYAWIIDGIKVVNNSYAFNCNWGDSGVSNGWCYGNPYTEVTKNDTFEYAKNVAYLYINNVK